MGGAFQREIHSRLDAKSDYQEVLGVHSEEHGFQAMIRLAARSRRPTAILAGSSLIAQGVLRACQQLDLAVPGDISLVAFDGSGPLDLLRPSVTSVSVSMAEVAVRGLTLLRRHANRGSRPLTDRVAVTLVVRGSTSAPRRRKAMRA